MGFCQELLVSKKIDANLAWPIGARINFKHEEMHNELLYQTNLCSTLFKILTKALYLCQLKRFAFDLNL